MGFQIFRAIKHIDSQHESRLRLIKCIMTVWCRQENLNLRVRFLLS